MLSMTWCAAAPRGERLQWEAAMRSQTQADRIEPQLLAGRPPYFVRLYWQSVESSLEQMRDTLGVSSGGSTVLRPTPLHESILPLLDQAVSQVDVFLAGTNPLVFGIADVPRVQRDARNLQNAPADDAPASPRGRAGDRAEADAQSDGRRLPGRL